jgi:hypothetical protein
MCNMLISYFIKFFCLYFLVQLLLRTEAVAETRSQVLKPRPHVLLYYVMFNYFLCLCLYRGHVAAKSLGLHFYTKGCLEL